jgi:hypothetical protein
VKCENIARVFITICKESSLLNMQRCGSPLVFPLLLLSILGTALCAQEIKPGEIHASVTVQQDPAYSYALYLPSNYTPQKRWPILLAFDPFGHGISPVKLFQKGAEKYGFIVVGSNNSRNFSDPSRAIHLMWDDVIHKFAIDPRGFYTAASLAAHAWRPQSRLPVRPVLPA